MEQKQNKTHLNGAT